MFHASSINLGAVGRTYSRSTPLTAVNDSLPHTSGTPPLTIAKRTVTGRADFGFSCCHTRSILKAMSHATLIYPHQLYREHPAIAVGRPIFLVEEPLLLTEVPTHRQKLMLHRLSMESYLQKLQSAGHQATIVPISTTSTTESIFAWLAAHHFTDIHVVDTTDDWLEQRISAAVAEHRLTRHSYESPLFYFSKSEACAQYLTSKRHLARFYQGVRRTTGILMTETGEPEGGSWSYDTENRQKLPKHFPLPPDPSPLCDDRVRAAAAWVDTIPGEHYGDTAPYWLPYTHEAATAWLTEFIKTRLTDFGPYEDAMTTTHVRLFHSTLSPLMNIGLLTPHEIIEAVLAHHRITPVPLPSLEGFIRQIIGWREFIRAAYEVDGRKMRTRNFWQHDRQLPVGFWDAATGIPPLDTCIRGALSYGYSHHIERLMVLGNFLLLTKTNPDEVYRWFMAMYVDAYDWVMVPNVYGMSQFADGGLFATKPYLSGSNYVRKMSDHPAGEWTGIWDALYWNFIHEHEDFFRTNHRLSMMPRLLAKMDASKRASLFHRATVFLQNQ